MSLLLLADSLSAAARSPLKQLTASLDHLLNRLHQTSHVPVGQNSHSGKNKADISPTADKAVHSTHATNAISACKAQFICNLYTVCVSSSSENRQIGPCRPRLPIACEAVLAPQPGCMFRENYLASAGNQISDNPFVHSQHQLP